MFVSYLSFSPLLERSESTTFSKASLSAVISVLFLVIAAGGAAVIYCMHRGQHTHINYIYTPVKKYIAVSMFYFMKLLFLKLTEKQEQRLEIKMWKIF